ncbi:MAG: glycosyltransferase family 4 protein [Elusimicrobia bacterium]|jgi:glycosyltransferase involved in cell wall biosynthesis|nr:glycosyltransferase family 4 protein [Elusimicrobiota bacterium]
MKIAYLTNFLTYGGGTRSLFLLLKSLGPMHLEKKVLVSEHPTDSFERVFLKHCGSVELIKNKPLSPGASCVTLCRRRMESPVPLIHSLSLWKPDIVHINGVIYPHLLEEIKKQLQCAVIVHVREHRKQKGALWGGGASWNFAIKQIYRWADAIIAISDVEAEYFRGHPNLHVIPNPFDFSVIKKPRSGIREEFGIQKKVLLIGVLSDCYRSKGQLDFVEAMGLVAKRFPGMEVLGVMMGSRPLLYFWRYWNRQETGRQFYGRQIRKRISSLGLDKRILFLPHREDIFGVLNDLDVMVRPSRLGDPWGRDVIEAMAFGKPVVATGTSNYYVENEITGYLVPPYREDLLADRIEDLIRDSSKRKSFGERGQEKVWKMCDLQNYGHRIMDLYDNLLRNQGATSW